MEPSQEQYRSTYAQVLENRKSTVLFRRGLLISPTAPGQEGNRAMAVKRQTDEICLSSLPQVAGCQETSSNRYSFHLAASILCPACQSFFDGATEVFFLLLCRQQSFTEHTLHTSDFYVAYSYWSSLQIGSYPESSTGTRRIKPVAAECRGSPATPGSSLPTCHTLPSVDSITPLPRANPIMSSRWPSRDLPDPAGD